MNAKLIIEGREFDLEILDEELQKLVSKSKKTGYERVGKGEKFFAANHFGQCLECVGSGTGIEEAMYDIGNYYSDKTVADNNIRADNLMRQLRRFSTKSRTRPLFWGDEWKNKWSIFYNYEYNRMDVWDSYNCKEFGGIYFDKKEAAELAIKEFHDELMWYFNEYKDSL